MKMIPVILLFLLVIPRSGAAQTGVRPDIELVESIPVETLLDNPEIRDTREVWLEMIRAATRSLDIEQFYISNKPDEPLEEVIREILKAGERGVSVRVIVDARMFKTYPESVTRLGEGINVATRIMDVSKLSGGIQHAKYFIVDGEEIFLGSQNFDWRALTHIHELGLRIRQRDLAGVYGDIFNLDWELAAHPGAPAAAAEKPHRKQFLITGASGETIGLRPTASPKSLLPDTSMWDEPNILELIDAARSELFCQFLSYSPVGRDKSLYTRLEDALKRAALRGVKVSLLVSDWEKARPAVDYLKSLSSWPNISVRFSEIPEWTGGYVSYARVEHCKFIIADSRAFWLGTSNAEKSYFYTSRNLGIVVEGAVLSAQIRKIFLKSWDGPYATPVRPEVEYKVREHGDR